MGNSSRAFNWLSTREGLCTTAGFLGLAATTNANIMHAGGYLTTNAPIIAGMSFGIFAGARWLGASPKELGAIGIVLIGSMIAGESYNFIATGEMTIADRDAKAAPLRAAAQRHQDAETRLKEIEGRPYESDRLKIARQAVAALKDDTETTRVSKARADLDKARAAVLAEAGNGCKTKCDIKKKTEQSAQSELDAALAAQRSDRAQAIADAQSELRAAASASEAAHIAAIAAARDELRKNPVPQEDAPLSSKTGWSAWIIDLVAAGLRSFGSNVLAAVLIAIGARCRNGAQKSGNMSEKSESEKSGPFEADNDPGPDNPAPQPPVGPSGPPSGKRGRRVQSSVIEFSDSFRTRTGRTPTGQEIRAEFPDLPRSTAYDYATRVRVAG